jgi:hypothetical protein
MALDPVTAGLDLVNTTINKIWPDKSEQEKQQLAAAVSLVQGQLNVNIEEAKSASIFVSGWRPFIGWVCGSALAYTYLGYPLLIWAASIWKPELTVPKLGNDGMLYELLFGMLGMGGLRTFEKVKGVA